MKRPASDFTNGLLRDGNRPRRLGRAIDKRVRAGGFCARRGVSFACRNLLECRVASDRPLAERKTDVHRASIQRQPPKNCVLSENSFRIAHVEGLGAILKRCAKLIMRPELASAQTIEWLAQPVGLERFR